MRVVSPVAGVTGNVVEAQLRFGTEFLPADVNGEFTVAHPGWPASST